MPHLTHTGECKSHGLRRKVVVAAKLSPSALYGEPPARTSARTVNHPLIPPRRRDRTANHPSTPPKRTNHGHVTAHRRIIATKVASPGWLTVRPDASAVHKWEVEGTRVGGSPYAQRTQHGWFTVRTLFKRKTRRRRDMAFTKINQRRTSPSGMS